MSKQSQIISRRQFLRGDISGRRCAQRPPWAVPETEFLACCNGCGDCSKVCGQRVIRLADGGYPQVDFSQAECTFCSECARACTQGALAWSAQGRPWQLVARIQPECLAIRGVVCRSCGERCEAGAIRFQLVRGGAAQPQVEAGSCTGCGACVGVCPVQAIALRDETFIQEACA